MILSPALLLIAVSAAPSERLELKALLAKHLAARGGIERLQKFEREHFDGTIAFSPKDTPHPLSVDIEEVAKIRQQITLDAGTMKQVSDGTQGVVEEPGKPPRAASADEVKNLRGSAELRGQLLGYPANGNTLTLAPGKPGEPYRITIALKEGGTRTDVIDPVTYLESEWTGEVRWGGAVHSCTSQFKDWRKVNGVMVSFAIDSRCDGAADPQQIRLSTVVVDAPADPKTFVVPALSSPDAGAGVVKKP